MLDLLVHNFDFVNKSLPMANNCLLNKASLLLALTWSPDKKRFLAKLFVWQSVTIAESILVPRDVARLNF